MLEDSGGTVVLTNERLLSRWPALGARAVCVDSRKLLIEGYRAVNPQTRSSPQDLAYVIYTSGSTGQPKGVPIQHRAFTNLLCSMRREPGLTARDRLLAVTSLSFDIAGLELFTPLISGARVVIPGEGDVYGVKLMHWLESSQATVMQATPSTWQMLIDAGWQSTPGLKMLCGGEALSPALAKQLLRRGGTLWNMYGPTETTVWSSCYEVKRGDTLIDLGYPIANTQFYVLDAERKPVPFGVIGGLYIGGDGVAQGYLKRPELTAERFIDIPDWGLAVNAESRRLYRTGDLVRRRPDGTLEFLGREDSQVKVRGYRIELGSIESGSDSTPECETGRRFGAGR